MDLTGYTKQTEIPYPTLQEVDISTADHVVSNGPARGVIITASGNLVFKTWHDETTVTLPIAVPTDGHFELRGYLIKAIVRTNTTATVPYVCM